MSTQAEENQPPADPPNEGDIAIIGMSGRFPGARNLEEFWKNLIDGIESISRFSDEEMVQSGVPESFRKNPSYVKVAPILEGPGLFDAAFFGFSPTEARTMDPQHRILLELAYEALENAGCNPERYPGRIGVFTGSAMNTYFMSSGLSGRFAEDYIPTLIVNDKDFLSTRISYKLNLKGPSITIQTACSTSLVAVHLARQSLLSEETDMALAGAISVRVPHQAGYFCDGGGVVSPDGHVRAFDANANGTVFGSGGGIIVLKRVADAMANGDTIYAVIKGSAVNNDGSEKAGYTAPSVNSQADAVVEALANAGVDAESIAYIEAHGSGTPVGDPIEIMALTKAFRTFTQRSGYCAIGSVKTNVGHLDAAAGIAGIIKTVLALRHGQLPPSLHYAQPNPEIDFSATPFYVNTTLCPWTGAGPKRAGVMSTGMGGTNAHVVLEEAPVSAATVSSDPYHLLILSAKTATALDTGTNRLLEFLENNPAAKMEDIAYTLQTGRKAFPHRRVLICADRDDAIATHSQEESKRIVSSHVDESSRRPLIFLLPGIGDHYVGMAHDLYQEWEVFRQEVDRCAALLDTHLGVDIREIIYPKTLSEKEKPKNKGIDLKKMLGRNGEEPEDPAAQKLNQTIYAQPALFTIEYALARLWQNLGITPDAIVGHSMGEYVAACLAGVFSLDDALQLIAQRAKRVNELPRGAMLAVILPEAEVLPLLSQHLSISLINGPNLCVVAGPVPAVAELEKTLNEKGIISRPVQNAHAFHSRMLDPIVPGFAEDVEKVRLHEPKIPFISNVTGNWITKAEATDPGYWARHANQTARFSDALHHLSQFKNAILLEAGPGKTLGVLAAQHPDRREAGDAVNVSSLRHHYENKSDVEFLLHSVGKLWLSGVEIDWPRLHQKDKRRLIPLPTYPFERQLYWIEPRQRLESAAKETAGETSRSSIDSWFYTPSWERSDFPSIETNACGIGSESWLILSGGGVLGAKLSDVLKRLGGSTTLVRLGQKYGEQGQSGCEIDAASPNDYIQLIKKHRVLSGRALNIIHLGCLTGAGANVCERSPESYLTLGFYSFLFLAQSIGELGLSIPVRIGVVSDGIHQVLGEERVCPEKATILGPCGVIPKEYPNVSCFNVDLPDTLSTEQLTDKLCERLLCEFGEQNRDSIIAYRGKYRWTKTYRQAELKGRSSRTSNVSGSAGNRLRKNGVYIITGGTGGIGLAIAKYLASEFKAKLVLTKKTQFPARARWRQCLTAKDVEEPIASTIKALLEIERLGGEVEVHVSDVADREQMQRVVAHTKNRFGALHGVIHAAGIVRAGLIQTKTKELAASVLSPKVEGTLVLHDVLREVDLDFLVLFSSITSIVSPSGVSDYSAANAFLDAFACLSNVQRSYHTVTINWPGWRETGMLAKLKSPAGAEWWKEEALRRGILTQDGLAVFERALNADVSQVIVSPEDLESALKWAEEPIELNKHSSNTENRPALDDADKVRNRMLGAPRNETEETVAGIWKKVLGVSELGTTENFSDLGGHSLLAIKIVSELRSAFRIDLPVRTLFEAPTVAELSAYIVETQHTGLAQPDGVIQVRNEPQTSHKTNDLLERFREENPELLAEDAFIVPRWFVQQKTWLEDFTNSDSAVYNYPLLLRIRGPLNETALRQSLQEIVRRHQVFRSIFRIKGGELVQIIVPPQEQALRVKDLSDLPEAEREMRSQQIAMEEANQPFDLTKGPLLRTALMRLAVDDHVLQLTIHHMVHDDWSTGILARNLSELYQAFAAEQKSPLREVTFQYGDYIRWQQEQLQGKRLKLKLSHWKQQLANSKGFQHLATDFPRPAKCTNRGGRESVVLLTDLGDLLNELSRRERVSMFMVLLAGFQCLLHRYSKHEEIGVATCAANRPIGEVEGLIGRFGNDMLLRTSLSGNPTFRELLKRVRETALTAYSDQDLPFGTLLAEAANGAEPTQNLPFQVMFILQNAPHENPQVPGLTMSWSPFYTGTAKYDLNVWLKIEPELEVILEYRADLFRAETMKQILADYEAILRTMVKYPGARIGNLRVSRKARTARLKPHPPVAKTLTGPQYERAPRDDVQSELVELWESVFGTGPIGVDQNFFELGGDSLLAARLFPKIEKAFQMDLPLATLLEAPTIKQLAEIISSRNVHSLGSSLVAIQPSGTKPPLFCVHGHMGEIFYCRNLSRSLGVDQPLYGLRSQGLGGEVPHHTVEEMAAHYLKEIRTLQPNGPYSLCGYCFGGMVAYEMARLLKLQGEDVALVVLFNAPAPGTLQGWPFNQVYLVKRIAHELRKMRDLEMREKLAVLAAKTAAFATLVSGVFKTALWRALSKFSIGRDRSGAPRLLSVADINVAAAKSYYPAAYPGRVILFLTEEVASLYTIDPRDGWRGLAEDGIEVHDVAGDNNSMFYARFVDALAGKLKSCLDRTQAHPRESAPTPQALGHNSFASSLKLAATESI